MKIKLRTILFSASIVCLILANLVVLNKDDISKSNFSLNMLLNQAFAQTEDPPGDGCTPECSPGFTCVNGVCVQNEAPTRLSCTTSVFCWLQLKWVQAPGHKQICPANAGGIPNCSGHACIADSDPCAS